MTQGNLPEERSFVERVSTHFRAPELSPREGAAFDQSVRSRLERRGGVRRVLIPVAAVATLALAVGVWLGGDAPDPEPVEPAQAAVETVTDEVNDIDWALSLADVAETSEHGFLPEEYQTIAALFLDEIDAP